MSPTPTAPRSRGDAGFTLIEVIVAMAVMLFVMSGVFMAMRNAMDAEESVRNITTMNSNLRSSMDLLVRDMLQVGQGLPVGRVIGIPNGPGATPIVRPGPDEDAANNCDGTTTFPVGPTLPAVSAGPDLGPAINGQCTDVINMLAHDGIFESVNASAFAADGRSMTIYPYGRDGQPATPDDIDISDAPDVLGDNIRPGDLLEIVKGTASTLVQVTAVAGQVVTFAPNDSLNLNQFDTGLAMLGTTNQVRATAPVDTAANVVVAGRIQPGPTWVSRVRMITYFIDTTTDPTSPRLMRQVNNGQPNAVSFELEAFRLTYDIADGTVNPTGVRMDPVDYTTGGACAPMACSPNQLRKANVSLAIRSERATATAGHHQNVLFTQVALRSLSFVDRF
jgi:prepilin-type N-terminal cleavage/methylation domain-containing protein